MKRALHGMPAYSSILSAELPAKTKTYTPIKHSDIINKVRTEIRDAGFVIKDEIYKSSNEGMVGVGTYRLQYKSDSDIDLSASFVNSYNKQYAFRFILGGINKLNQTSMLLNPRHAGAYKKIHRGDADILAAGKIAEFIGDAGEYWELLLEHKDMLKEVKISTDVRDLILGKLFFRESVLNGMQMNMISKEIAKPSYVYSADPDSAWVLYNHIALAMKESRPATWIPDQLALHDAFDEIINFDSKERGHSIVGLTSKRFFSSGALEKKDHVTVEKKEVLLSGTELHEAMEEEDKELEELEDKIPQVKSKVKVTTIKASDFVAGKYPKSSDYSGLSSETPTEEVGDL